MALTIAAASTQAMGAGLATNIGAAATIEIRSGTKPATPETAASGTLLATVAISGSFTSTGGVLTSADVKAALATAVLSGGAVFGVKNAGTTVAGLVVKVVPRRAIVSVAAANASIRMRFAEIEGCPRPARRSRTVTETERSVQCTKNAIT